MKRQRGRQSEVGKKSKKVSDRMAENKGSGGSNIEMERTRANTQHTRAHKKRGWRGAAQRWRRAERATEAPEADRVTFTVRADQFPVPSIIDVTSTVGCYLSGLTNRNTIPTGTPTHTYAHTRTHTCVRGSGQTKKFHTLSGRNLLANLEAPRGRRNRGPEFNAAVCVPAPAPVCDISMADAPAPMSAMLSFINWTVLQAET